jgi:tripartite-type tricarboxylate transporter receptor subunit TctC
MISRRAVLTLLGTAAGVAAIARVTRAPGHAPGPCAAVAGGRIRWIVPNAAGGGYDTESRLIERFLERRLGVEIGVDNVPGAGGIAGARAIAGAAPDGRTLGIAGVPGLLAAALAGGPGVPNPATDFTILGRVSRSWHVWATGRGSALTTIDAALTAGETRPLLFAINEVGSANFVSITASAAALGVAVELVAGFDGTRQASLAAMRGDVDLVCFNFETIRDLIEAGDLRPLLQISGPPGLPHAALRGVGTLGGPDGWAARRARARGDDESASSARADALVTLIGTGRVILAPRGLESSLRDCLAAALYDALMSDELRAAAGRTLDVAPAADAAREIHTASDAARALIPDIQAAMQRVRR